MLYNGIFALYADKMYLRVWKPSLDVTISPASLTVFNYEQIALKCSEPDIYEIYFKWYKDGVEIVSGGKFSRSC